MPNPVEVARQLLGTEIVTRIKGEETVGRITETEAYWAPDDQASHARNHRRTARTETFYAAPGTAYVYLCYGIHEMFNVVSGPEGLPHAILIRAVEPVSGLDIMQRRRRSTTEVLKPQLTAGPGVLSKALGIDRRFNGNNLLDISQAIFLRIPDVSPKPEDVVAVPRVGIAYAGSPWVEKPWRFYLRDNLFVSRK